MPSNSSLSRKEFLTSLLLAAAGAALPAGAAVDVLQNDDITLDDLKSFQKIAGLKLTDDELKSVLASVRSSRRVFEANRAAAITYQVEPLTVFRPEGRVKPSKPGVSIKTTPVGRASMPSSSEDVAFLSVRELGALIRAKKVSPVELTRLYLDRLAKYGGPLLCLVTLCEDLAMEQAKRAEAEQMQGHFRGPLHGIPYGIKDLFATKGIPTTWGAAPYQNQVFDYDAGVVTRLKEAGAILLAKLSLGALAQGDVWFKGRTKNPWNPGRGSSGSSAGSSCATAAGLAAFCIGTETLGSIMSPTHECRITGLRPTYGRVSRYGAMAVSWTMDKVGPICRSAEDCAIVFSAIQGADPRDASSVDRPFHWDAGRKLKGLKVGYVPINRNGTEQPPLGDALVTLCKDLGIELKPVKFDPPGQGSTLVLGVEAAAAFDEFTRTEKIYELKDSTWPLTYRSNRFVPAVEFLQAQRARTLIARKFEEQFGDLDLVIADERGGQLLFITNLTGHPQVLVPIYAKDGPGTGSVSVVGRLYDEETALAFAKAIQTQISPPMPRPNLAAVG